MYDGFRNGTFALGLTVGILLTILACYYIPILNGNNGNTEHQTNHSQVNESNYSNGSGARGTDKRFDPWEEGYAQWVMAIFTVVIAGLTGVALCYIKKTADFTNKTLAEASKTAEAAKETVTVTREMSQAQTRAYLSCIGARCWLADRHLFVECTVKNYGQSPAMNVVSKLNFDYDAVDNPQSPDSAVSKKSLDVIGGDYLIPSGAEVPIRYLITKDLVGSDDLNAIKEIIDDSRLHFFTAEMSWIDVFDKKCVLNFNIFNDGDDLNLRISHKPSKNRSQKS